MEGMEMAVSALARFFEGKMSSSPATLASRALGFVALTDDASILYKVDNDWNAGSCGATRT